ncbi:cryptochrome [Acephala macrosclerotiorum]|nr:cryptochrome [Acephala macrosclerotiorum]
MSDSRVLVYLVRRDLRVSDNPVLHSLATNKDHGFTHLLPLYVFNAQQLEISGFLKEGEPKSPYREARSQVGGFWRCGPHRAKFLAESIWDLKNSLEKVDSGLCIRVGMPGEVVNDILTKSDLKVGAVWMVAEEGVEENREERSVRNACRDLDVEFKLWTDEKYLIDDRDLPLDNIEELSDVFTTYRKTVEPLRNHPRPVLPSPEKGSLPQYPSKSSIPEQYSPFTVPTTESGLKAALLQPLLAQDLIKNPPAYPEGAASAHPFIGGETNALTRLNHLITSGAVNTYHETRNGLLGEDFSTKLSAYLVLGCITSRQIHGSLRAYEDGTNPAFAEVGGYGKGQPEKGGTYSIRFELLWRDYMRLCTRKFGVKLFRLSGFKAADDERWRTPDQPRGATPEEIKGQIERFLNGTTGMGLIDASLRELYHTGYTSNRARQNVASFLAKHLKLDWRIGAEWYECMLIDYDLSSNWGNWQYLAGVGNDPRGEARIFNPVKQAFDYDPQGEYVKAWVPETRRLTEPSEIFQPWTVGEDRREELGLKGLPGVENPLLKIDFTGSSGRGGGYGEGRGRGAPYGYQQRYNTGRGFGSSRGGHGRGGYYGGRGTGGRDERRMGMMDRETGIAEYAQAQ